MNNDDYVFVADDSEEPERRSKGLGVLLKSMTGEQLKDLKSLVNKEQTVRDKKNKDDVYRAAVIERLKVENKSGDTEAAHVEADKILMYLLIRLGYQDVVDEYDKIDKWYV